MATFVVCSRCGRVQEILGIDQYPATWGCADSVLLCPRCILSVRAPTTKDVLDEEVIYPKADDSFDDSFDEEECDLCRGPCSGH